MQCQARLLAARSCWLGSAARLGNAGPGSSRPAASLLGACGPGAAGVAGDAEAEPGSWGPREEKSQLSVDVSGFSPEGLMVRMEGRSVTVTGKHEYRELRTQAELPEDMDLQAVTCCLSRDRQLCIQAPHPAPPPVKGRTLPISIQQAQEAGTGKEPRSSKGLGREPAGGSEGTRAS
uniref:SHSP domain-containing protein n=1 Tax=Gopherus agassizii TaxID=38772 RepID=A0A452J6Q1_9SAUR